MLDKNGFKPISFVLLKLSNTCNINCTYCYWFKDDSVYEKTKQIKEEILELFYEKLQNHISTYQLSSFTISLHGGEPLLAGKRKIASLLRKLRQMEEKLGIKIKILLQTNGVLLDEEWVTI